MLYSFHYNTFIFWKEIIALLTSKQWMILDNSLKSFEKKRKKRKKTVIGVSYKMAAKMGNYPISFWHSHFFSYILFFPLFYLLLLPPHFKKSSVWDIFREIFLFGVSWITFNQIISLEIEIHRRGKKERNTLSLSCKIVSFCTRETFLDLPILTNTLETKTK